LPRSFSEAIQHIREMQDKGRTSMADDRITHGDRSESDMLQSPHYVEDESEN
jgi:hypothetical protein